MTNIGWETDKTNDGPLCIGSGFVALDVVQSESGSFSAVGGSCGNVMAILAWLGWKARPSARLGADPNGVLVLSAFRDVGVDPVHLLQDKTVSTPVVIQRFVENAEGQRVHRFFLFCPDCGVWLPRFRPTTKRQVAPIMDGTAPRAFYFDRVSPSSLELASWAAHSGSLVLFEPSSICDERAFQRAINTCHILKYSKDRLGHLPDFVAIEQPKLIVETHGGNGLRVRWHGRWSQLPAFRVPVVVDAAGAGDWCSAGLIHHLARQGTVDWAAFQESDIHRALRSGQAMAAINCGFEGARGAMTSLSFQSFARTLCSLVQNPIKHNDLKLHHASQSHQSNHRQSKESKERLEAQILQGKLHLDRIIHADKWPNRSTISPLIVNSAQECRVVGEYKCPFVGYRVLPAQVDD